MNSKVNKCSGGIRSEERINSQIIASRDEVEQYATNIDHQRVGFSTPRSRYHLPPTTPKSHFVERDNRDKKIKDTAKHFVWIVVSFLTLSIILYYLINSSMSKRKMLREPDKSKIIVERDVDRTPKAYNVMFQFERAHWINNGPEIDDLMEISQMLSDKEVSAADLRKAIAIMHTKVNRYDEFTDKCNFVLTSMREVYEDAEDFKWICSNNSLTKANLDWYLSKERAHWTNNGPEKDKLRELHECYLIRTFLLQIFVKRLQLCLQKCFLRCMTIDMTSLQRNVIMYSLLWPIYRPRVRRQVVT